MPILRPLLPVDRSSLSRLAGHGFFAFCWPLDGSSRTPLLTHHAHKYEAFINMLEQNSEAAGAELPRRARFVQRWQQTVHRQTVSETHPARQKMTKSCTQVDDEVGCVNFQSISLQHSFKLADESDSDHTNTQVAYAPTLSFSRLHHC